MKRQPKKSMPKRAQRGNYQDQFAKREFDKGFSKGKKFESDFVKVTADNDPDWYFSNEQILNDVASFSFNKPVGTKIEPDAYWVQSANVKVNSGLSAIPGLMSVAIGLTAGYSDEAQSPLNLAATNAYSFVRYKNSGARNYDSPDLMLYLVAMDSLYACWNWMKRLYGIASTYSSMNRYMPRAYFVANGVDFDDVMANLANFRGYLNIKANEIAAFCVPATMKYNLRHSWLFSNIYKDSNTAKAQQYMYVPAWFYKYDETSSQQGGQLVPVNVLNNYIPGTSALLKVADLMQLLNSMLEAVNYSEDIGIMSGDILKAYGAGGLFTLSDIADDYKVYPVFSEEVLTQIENMRVLDVAAAQLSTFAITQDPDTNYLLCMPKVHVNGNGGSKGQYLNFHWENPTPKQVMVATRLNAVLVPTTGSTTTYDVMNFGSEVACNSYIYTFTTGDFNEPYDGTKPLSLTAVNTIVGYIDLNTVTVATAARQLTTLGYLADFDWAPPQNIAYYDGTTVCIVGTTRDVDNYALISDSNLEAMNLLALLTEFNVPN